MRFGSSHESRALWPWIGAAFVWFGVVAPLRTDEGDRLVQQSRVRRERLKAERALHEIRDLRSRMTTALALSCRASAEPAALRQGAIAATSRLALSPFSLSVTGGPSGGATVDAGGSRQATLELLGRLGNPARGGFLRSASLRDREGRWSVSTSTGVLSSLPSGLPASTSRCPGTPDLIEPVPAPAKVAVAPTPRPARPAPTPEIPLVQVPDSAAPEPPPAPFTLVAFLNTGGRGRVSIRVGNDVRVISVGDEVDGWRCISIDRDEGAVFISAAGARFVLTAPPSDR